jgi:hypothetical protein
MSQVGADGTRYGDWLECRDGEIIAIISAAKYVHITLGNASPETVDHDALEEKLEQCFVNCYLRTSAESAVED